VLDYDTTVNESPIDISGQGNNGTFVNGGASYSAADKAFDFDGSSGLIVSGPLSPVMTGDRICSMSAWFKTTNASTVNQSVMWLGAYSVAGLLVVTVSNGALSISIGNGCNLIISGVIESNQWYHVVGVKAGTGSITSSNFTSAFKLYLNGKPMTGTFGGQARTLNVTTNYLYIGAGSSVGQEPFSGFISNPRLYNVALEASEAKKLYNLGRTGRSMVISDTAVGIGKVPEAQLDVKGTIKGMNMTTCPVFFDATATASTAQNNNMDFNSVNASFGGGLVGTRFTAPIRGYYYFSIFFMGPYTTTGQLWVSFMKNGAEEGLNVENARMYDNRGTTGLMHGQNSGSAIIFLNGTGDYVEMLVKGGNAVHSQYNRFQGFYLSA